MKKVYEDEKKEVPDGGYAWVIVFASFITNALVWGLYKSHGLLLVEFLNHFHGEASVAKLSFISGTTMGVANLFAPFSINLGKVVGFRKQMVIGGVMAALGHSLCVFATEIWHLYVTLGVITGIGFSLSWVPSAGRICHYFDVHRTKALGFMASGAGFGSFVFPYIIQYLLDTYSYKGALLILGGIELHLCVAGALYRPVHECFPRARKQHARIPSFRVQKPEPHGSSREGGVRATSLNDVQSATVGHTDHRDGYREVRGTSMIKLTAAGSALLPHHKLSTSLFLGLADTVSPSMEMLDAHASADRHEARQLIPYWSPELGRDRAATISDNKQVMKNRFRPLGAVRHPRHRTVSRILGTLSRVAVKSTVTG